MARLRTASTLLDPEARSGGDTLAGTPLQAPDLGPRELARIVKLVYEKSGISLHDGKRELISARLNKRLRAGGFAGFADYLAYLDADQSGDELNKLLDAIATNHTSFFREEQHFRFLTERVLPPLAARPRPIRGWSAACSTGEEPFTIVISLFEKLPAPDHSRVRMLASDLSMKALAVGRSATYKLETVRSLPIELLRKYFERGMGDQEGRARVKPEVRGAVEFRRLNLLENPQIGEPFDFIFCRNVMIYFDQPVRQRVVSMLERNLAPGGYLFISHSESLSGVDHAMRWVAPAVYQRVP